MRLSEPSWDEMHQPFTLYPVDSQVLRRHDVTRNPQQK